MAALRVDDVVQTRTGLACGCTAPRRSPSGPAGALGPTKTHRTRTAPVPVGLDEYVRTRVALAAPCGYLFPEPDRGRVDEHQPSGGPDGGNKAGRGQGDDDPRLRRTAASLLIAAVADVKAVQVILGQSVATTTTDLCGYLFSEATWQAMERLPVIPLMKTPLAIETTPS